ncbi:BZIP domain-containing protein [Fusarium falciforme]|uniref:BZIP domain-containing protein n=1 Tax=Fusarium falciforme TaxID=195108 RepID=UPI002301D6EE|nr:BZIP domain-containing protein [Fusarium falciforme]WAO82866.1 BZIP domain-containing protein [Fusarium falciforme]
MSMFISPPAYAKVPPRRQYLGASSALSASANPDEDWTKGCPPVGKKLKRRLEDLEHCAGSSDYAESGKQPQRIIKSKRSFSSSKPRKSQPATTAKPVDSQGPFTPPMEPTDDLFFPGTYDDRTRSRSPPQFACSTYPVPDEIVLALEGSAQPYPIMTTADDYPNYLLAPIFPMMLPSMTHFSDVVKWELYLAYNGLTPYTSHGYMPPMDFNAPSPYD